MHLRNTAGQQDAAGCGSAWLLTPQSAPKVDPTHTATSAATNSGFECCTGVNVGRRKGSIFGAATQFSCRRAS